MVLPNICVCVCGPFIWNLLYVTQSFEVDPRFLENFCTPALYGFSSLNIKTPYLRVCGVLFPVENWFVLLFFKVKFINYKVHSSHWSAPHDAVQVNLRHVLYHSSENKKVVTMICWGVGFSPTDC